VASASAMALSELTLEIEALLSSVEGSSGSHEAGVERASGESSLAMPPLERRSLLASRSRAESARASERRSLSEPDASALSSLLGACVNSSSGMSSGSARSSRDSLPGPSKSSGVGGSGGSSGGAADVGSGSGATAFASCRVRFSLASSFS
jgi:hypothetical protein